MAIFVPFDIAYEIVQLVLKDEPDRRSPSDVRIWKATILALRATSQSFRIAMGPKLFEEARISRIDHKSLHRMDTLLNLPLICSYIRKYSFSRVRGPGHQIRTELPRRLEDALSYHRPQKAVMEFSQAELAEAQDEPYKPCKSRLTSLPYLGIILYCSNLSVLGIDFDWAIDGSDASFHYRLRNDISEGLGSLLVTSLVLLRDLSLDNLSLTDLEHLVDSVTRSQKYQDDPLPSKLEILRLIFQPETLTHKGRQINYIHRNGRESRADAHTSGGRCIHELLKLSPRIHILDLSYGIRDNKLGTFLILQYFDPPLLELQTLYLRGLCLTTDALMKLTFKDSAQTGCYFDCRKYSDLALYDENLSWTDISKAWSSDQQWLHKNHPHTNFRRNLFVSGSFKSFDHSAYSEEDLKNMRYSDVPVLRSITEAEKEQLKAAVQNPPSIWFYTG